MQDGNATAEPPPEWVDTGAVRAPGAPVKEGVFTRILIPAVSALMALSALAILFILIRDTARRSTARRRMQGAGRNRPFETSAPIAAGQKAAEPGSPRVYRVPKG